MSNVGTKAMRNLRRLFFVVAIATLAAALLGPTLRAQEPHLLTSSLAKRSRAIAIESSPTIVDAVSLEVLGGREIACLAAQRWLPAELLRTRAQGLVQIYCEQDECKRQAAGALSSFLRLQAEHQQNIGAASGLRAYYTRIAIAEQLELTEASLKLIESESERQTALQQAGLSAGTDLTSFERLRLEVSDQRLQLQSQDRQLRGLLAQLTGRDYDASSVRQEQLEIFESSIDIQRLQSIALAQRKDLAAWRYLLCHVTEDSASVFAEMLATAAGGWGLPVPVSVGIKYVFCPPDFSCLAANIRQEIRVTIETHDRWIRQAVDEKSHKLRLAYDRIRLAQETVSSWDRRLEQLARLSERGNGQAADSAEARSAQMAARSEEIHRRLDAKLAEIDLAEATGLLHQRCCAGQAWLQTGYE